MVTLQLRQISIPVGQRILLNEVSWQEFEAILEELGEKRTTRLAYYILDREFIPWRYR